MTNWTLLSRAGATATAVLGACLLALAAPDAVLAAGAAKATGAATATGENTPLNLGSSSSTSSHTSSSGASIVRTIVGLAIVLAVIWGLSWILRQVKAGRDPHVSSEGLTSVAALNLSSGRSVHLVRAGNEYVLLGSAEHGVVPIHRYTEEQARSAGLLSVAEEAQPRRRTPREGRYDPTRIPSAGAGVLDRIREWTVRR